jgi:hypothetical protein
VIIRQPGDYVTFLGRVYVDAWSNNLSFFDPARCLSKLHFSDNCDRKISPSLCAWRKAVSYYVTDNGNFVGHIAQKMLEITGEGKTEVVERRPWLADVLESNTRYTTQQIMDKFRYNSIFPTYQSDPETLGVLVGSSESNGRYGGLDHSLIYLADQLNMSTVDILVWYGKFRKSNTLDFPLLYREPTPANSSVTITVDGISVGPDLQPAPAIVPAEKPACFYFFDPLKKGLKCKHGDKCKFSHSQEYNGKRICRDFLKNACKRDNCKFAHVAVSAKVT